MDAYSALLASLRPRKRPAADEPRDAVGVKHEKRTRRSSEARVVDDDGHDLMAAALKRVDAMFAVNEEMRRLQSLKEGCETRAAMTKYSRLCRAEVRSFARAAPLPTELALTVQEKQRLWENMTPSTWQFEMLYPGIQQCAADMGITLTDQELFEASRLLLDHVRNVMLMPPAYREDTPAGKMYTIDYRQQFLEAQRTLTFFDACVRVCPDVAAFDMGGRDFFDLLCNTDLSGKAVERCSNASVLRQSFQFIAKMPCIAQAGFALCLGDNAPMTFDGVCDLVCSDPFREWYEDAMTCDPNGMHLVVKYANVAALLRAYPNAHSVVVACYVRFLTHKYISWGKSVIAQCIQHAFHRDGVGRNATIELYLQLFCADLKRLKASLTERGICAEHINRLTPNALCRIMRYEHVGVRRTLMSGRIRMLMMMSLEYTRLCYFASKFALDGCIVKVFKEAIDTDSMFFYDCAVMAVVISMRLLIKHDWETLPTHDVTA
jgi:hypothetical protein